MKSSIRLQPAPKPDSVSRVGRKAPKFCTSSTIGSARPFQGRRFRFESEDVLQKRNLCGGAAAWVIPAVGRLGCDKAPIYQFETNFRFAGS